MRSEEEIQGGQREVTGAGKQFDQQSRVPEKKRRKLYTSEKRAVIEKLTISVSKLTNEKRLQRKSRRLEAFVLEQDEEV